MKNRKGFTLVEVLGVLVVLSIIMIIAYPAVNNFIGNSKTSINNMTKKNLEEAVKTLAAELVHCYPLQETLATFNSIFVVDAGITNCVDIRDFLYSSDNPLSVTVGYLIINDYFQDTNEDCNAEDKVEFNITQSNQKVTVDTTDACNN